MTVVDDTVALVQRRTVRALAASQVLGGIGVATGVAVSSLVAARLSGSDAVGGLAQTSAVVGAALVALPLARLSAAHGRRRALVVGYGLAAVGAGVCALAAALQTWPVLLLGPNLAGPAARLGLGEDAGPYVISAVAFGVAAVLVFGLLRPDPLTLANRAERNGAGQRSLRQGWAALAGAPLAWVALAAIVVSHVVMVGLMSMTPVHMGNGGATLRVIGLVISVHIAGMYALSPVVGWLADAVGRMPVLVLGGCLLGAAALAVAGASGESTGQLTVGLVLLGLGWSCGLVAGSALLIDSVPTADRTAVQGLSDVAMNTGGAAGGLAAGGVLALASYAALAVGATALVAVYLVVVLYAGWRTQRLRFI